jgi:hypothetical protein
MRAAALLPPLPPEPIMSPHDWTQWAMGLMAVGTVLTMLAKLFRRISARLAEWVTAQVFPRIDSLTESIDGLSEHVDASRAEFATFSSEQREWNRAQIEHNELVARRLGRVEGHLAALGRTVGGDTREHPTPHDGAAR